MGTWGVGILDSDLALDVRADVMTRLARGATAAAIVLAMRRRPSIFDDPDDGAVVLLALAETLHDVGRVHPWIATRADALLARGVEGAWANADKQTAKARAAALARLRAKLRAPPPRPQRLRPPTRLETRLRAGDVVALAARRGKTVLFVVEAIRSSPSGTYPELVLLDWCGAEAPPVDVVARLAVRFAWRQHSHLGDARVQARFLVGDMILRRSREPRYAVIGQVAPARLVLDGQGGGTITEVARLGGAALDDLSPQRFPHVPCFDPTAARLPAKARDEAVRAALAMGAILRHINDEPLDAVPARPTASQIREAKQVLRQAWGVRSRADALRALWELLQYGHSFDAFRMLTPQGAKEARAEDDDDRLRQLRAARRSTRWLRTKLLLAWDLGRASNVVSWSRIAGYITPAELQGFLVPAARRARATYTSWQEFGEHYCLGREYWFGEATDEREAMAALLAAPRSPWRTRRFR